MRVAMGEPERGGSTRDRLPRHRRKLLRASSSMTWDAVDAGLRRPAWRDASSRSPSIAITVFGAACLSVQN